MEELEEMGVYAEGASGGSSLEPSDNSAAEDSAVHVHPLIIPGLAWMLPWKWKPHYPGKSSPWYRTHEVPCPCLQGCWQAVPDVMPGAL